MDEKSLLLKKNKIMVALSEGEYQRLAPHLETVELRHAQVLYQMGGPVQYAYFPFNALISLVTQMRNGSIVEVGLIGNDGMSGLRRCWERKLLHIIEFEFSGREV